MTTRIPKIQTEIQNLDRNEVRKLNEESAKNETTKESKTQRNQTERRDPKKTIADKSDNSTG